MKINLITIASDEYQALENLTLPTKKEYCEKWRVNLDARNLSKLTDRVDRTAMSIDSLKTCDWLWFMGCDALITNMNIDVRSMIESFGDVDFVIGRDFYGINNDVVFFRNSEASFGFLKETLNNKTPNDQTEMKYVMDNNLVPNFKYLIKPQKLFNAYPAMDYYREIMKKQCHFEESPDNPSQWEVGDFIAHFPGMDNGMRLKRIPDILNKIVR